MVWPPVGVPGAEVPTVSMCPLLGWRCVERLPGGGVRLDAPAELGSRAIDFPVHQIMFMFAPTFGVLKEARRAGVRGVFRRKVPGLVEALERSGLKMSRD